MEGIWRLERVCTWRYVGSGLAVACSVYKRGLL